MTEQLKKFDIGRLHSTYPFVMVFAYGPEENVVYTGDLCSIRNHCIEMPTHHGFIRYFKNGMSPISCNVILGRNSRNILLKKINKNNCSEWFKSLYDGRSAHILIFKDNKADKDHSYKFVRRWRKLPKKYISDFATIDARLTVVDPCNNVSSDLAEFLWSSDRWWIEINK